LGQAQVDNWGVQLRPMTAFVQRLLKSRRVAWALSVAGFVVMLASVAVGAQALASGMFGLFLLLLGALCIFAQVAPLEREARRREEINHQAASLEDIKDAHWELADRASYYRALLDAQRDFVIRRSADGHLIFANRAFCDAFGVQREGLIGSTFEPHVFLEDESSELAGHGRRVVQLLGTKKGERWIAWDIQETKNEDGQSEFQSVGRDVTVERAIECELKEARNQAEAASRAKSRFLASMSHEIRTPMNGILGMISLMRDTQLDPEQRTCARIVEDSTRALLNLIDDILDFSKIEAGKIELANKTFSLKACVAQAMQLLAPGAAAKRLSFTSTITNDVPEWVLGDEMRVRQIVLNLLSNAVKFTEKGGIAVCVSRVDEACNSDEPCAVAIKVTDTGVGFPPEFLARIFDEFEQCDKTAASHPGGTGLGLAISKRLALAMGGDLVAEANLDDGSTFTATLRFDISERPSTDNSIPDTTARLLTCNGSTALDILERASPAGGFNVLIAEDNPINALLARKIVTRAGGCSTIVGDGRLAIAAVWETLQHRQPAFDLILMDVMMPGVDGLMAAKSIKELFKERTHAGLASPPIIALTANAFAEVREQCRAAGMDDYLAKPFEAHQLHDLLLRWMPQRAENASPAA
jgi:PAS domain S-box-containing protein